MSIEEVIAKKAEEIKEQAFEEIEKQVKLAEERFKREIERLVEAAKIVLPVNVLEVISKGGFIDSRVFEVGSDRTPLDYSVSTISGTVMSSYTTFARPLLSRGRYRVTLIVEKLE